MAKGKRGKKRSGKKRSGSKRRGKKRGKRRAKKGAKRRRSKARGKKRGKRRSGRRAKRSGAKRRGKRRGKRRAREEEEEEAAEASRRGKRRGKKRGGKKRSAKRKSSKRKRSKRAPKRGGKRKSSKRRSSKRAKGHSPEYYFKQALMLQKRADREKERLRKQYERAEKQGGSAKARAAKKKEREIAKLQKQIDRMKAAGEAARGHRRRGKHSRKHGHRKHRRHAREYMAAMPNPVSGWVEFGAGVVGVTLGAVVASGTDRYLAGHPLLSQGGPQYADQPSAGQVYNSHAVETPMWSSFKSKGWKRLLGATLSMAVPLGASHMVKSHMGWKTFFQLAFFGALGRTLLKVGDDTMAKVLKGKAFGARLYAPELNAESLQAGAQTTALGPAVVQPDPSGRLITVYPNTTPPLLARKDAPRQVGAASPATNLGPTPQAPAVGPTNGGPGVAPIPQSPPPAQVVDTPNYPSTSSSEQNGICDSCGQICGGGCGDFNPYSGNDGSEEADVNLQ